MRKKLIYICLAVLSVTMFFTVNTIGAEDAEQKIKVYLNGEYIQFSSQEPTVVERRTLIPLRGIFEKMGYSVSWDAKTKSCVISNDIQTITMRSGHKGMQVNEQAYMLDVSAQIINDSLMIPLRAVAECTGATVTWDAPTKSVYINSNQKEQVSFSVNEYVKEYTENISELAYLLKETLEPDYLDEELQHSDHLRAPFYFDCINYFNSFIKAMQEPWNKFDTITKVESHPCSSTNWSRYIQDAINPSNVLNFENRKNALSREHKEWQELIYVLNIAINEFESIKTPLFIKQRYFSEVSLLKKFLTNHPRMNPISMFQIHSFEPRKIKELKENANKLLTIIQLIINRGE